jgi:hypothetical protein
MTEARERDAATLELLAGGLRQAEREVSGFAWAALERECRRLGLAGLSTLWEDGVEQVVGAVTDDGTVLDRLQLERRLDDAALGFLDEAAQYLHTPGDMDEGDTAEIHWG